LTIAGGSLPIADCRRIIADCRLPIADWRLDKGEGNSAYQQSEFARFGKSAIGTRQLGNWHSATRQLALGNSATGTRQLGNWHSATRHWHSAVGTRQLVLGTGTRQLERKSEVSKSANRQSAIGNRQ
jgi:hypothetical protein